MTTLRKIWTGKVVVRAGILKLRRDCASLPHGSAQDDEFLEARERQDRL